MQELALAVVRRLLEAGGSSGFVETPAGALRYTARGPPAGPELLLLHGLGDSIASWVQVALLLPRHLRVHLLDLPGHGLSAKPPDYRFGTLVSAVAAYAGRLRAPIVAGHSLGGWIAARLVLSGAVVPARLVLINPGGARLEESAWAPFRALVSARDAAGVQCYLAAAFHRAPLLLRALPDEVRKAMWAEASQGVLDAVEAPDFLAEAELSALRVPTRLVWGEADRLLPGGTLEFFRRAIPHAELRLLPRAGHLPHVEAPRELARALVD